MGTKPITPKTKQKEKQTVDPDLIAAIKAQVMDELKDEHTRKTEEIRAERDSQQQKYKIYVENMQASSEPWVDVVGWTDTEKGVRAELEWNDAFVVYLKAHGLTGTDDENVVQKWVALLLRDMADGLEETNNHDGEFS